MLRHQCKKIAIGFRSIYITSDNLIKTGGPFLRIPVSKNRNKMIRSFMLRATTGSSVQFLKKDEIKPIISK